MNITIKHYATPVTWLGYIEPEDRSWIVFVDLSGAPMFFRRAVDGAVL